MKHLRSLIVIVLCLCVGISMLAFTACGEGEGDTKVVKSISVEKAPDKTTYFEDETFDPTGGMLKVTYEDGTTESISFTAEGVTIDTFSMSLPAGTETAKKTLTIRYGEKKATFEITVSIRKYSVIFDYNYDGAENDGHYWLDNYDYGEKITYVPQNPEREGYIFGGWFQEPECVNIWNFETDTLPEAKYNEEGEALYQETRLYAKWYVE